MLVKKIVVKKIGVKKLCKKDPLYTLVKSLTSDIEYEYWDCSSAEDIRIGFGKGDVTGTVTMVNMMGYVTPQQTATGLHGRLYASSRV